MDLSRAATSELSIDELFGGAALEGSITRTEFEVLTIQLLAIASLQARHIDMRWCENGCVWVCVCVCGCVCVCVCVWVCVWVCVCGCESFCQCQFWLMSN